MSFEDKVEDLRQKGQLMLIEPRGYYDQLAGEGSRFGDKIGHHIASQAMQMAEWAALPYEAMDKISTYATNQSLFHKIELLNNSHPNMAKLAGGGVFVAGFVPALLCAAASAVKSFASNLLYPEAYLFSAVASSVTGTHRSNNIG